MANRPAQIVLLTMVLYTFIAFQFIVFYSNEDVMGFVWDEKRKIVKNCIRRADGDPSICYQDFLKQREAGYDGVFEEEVYTPPTSVGSVESSTKSTPKTTPKTTAKAIKPKQDIKATNKPGKTNITKTTPKPKVVDQSVNIYLDVSKSWRERVDDLVKRLTLDDVILQTSSTFQAPTPKVKYVDVKSFVWYTECTSGQTSSLATAFPNSLGMAATFR